MDEDDLKLPDPTKTEATGSSASSVSDRGNHGNTFIPLSVNLPHAHLLTILQVGAQGSYPVLLSVDRDINVLESCLFSKYFVSRTSFRDVFFPFRWLSMSSHLSLGLPLGLFPFIFNFITTLSVESSSLLMTWPNHQSLFLLIT